MMRSLHDQYIAYNDELDRLLTLRRQSIHLNYYFQPLIDRCINNLEQLAIYLMADRSLAATAARNRSVALAVRRRPPPAIPPPPPPVIASASPRVVPIPPGVPLPLTDHKVLLSRKEFYDHVDSNTMRARDLRSGPKVCNICFESIEKNTTYHSPGCKHTYCKVCLYDWLTTHCTRPQCPACRYDVRGHTASRRKRKSKKKRVQTTTRTA